MPISQSLILLPPSPISTHLPSPPERPHRRRRRPPRTRTRTHTRIWGSLDTSVVIDCHDEAEDGEEYGDQDYGEDYGESVVVVVFIGRVGGDGG